MGLTTSMFGGGYVGGGGSAGTGGIAAKPWMRPPTGAGLPDLTGGFQPPSIPQPSAPHAAPVPAPVPAPAPDAPPRVPQLPPAPAAGPKAEPDAPPAVQSLLAMSAPQEPAEGFVQGGPAGPLNPRLGQRTPPDAVRILSQLAGGAY